MAQGGDSMSIGELAGSTRWAMRALLVFLPLLFACAGWPGGASGTDPAAGASAQANEEQPKLVTPTELRFRLERFADGLAEALSSPLDDLLATEPDIRKRKIVLDAKYSFSSNAVFIASGPYPSVSLLDMVVFVNVVRASIDRDGQRMFGEAIHPLSRAARKYEGEVWELAGGLLSAAQLDDLRSLIVSWIAANADRGYSEAVRFDSFASDFEGAQERKASGLLSQIRNVTATADQALELAERMNYFFQRAPAIWRLHGQLAFFELASQPEISGVLANTDSIAASTDRLSRSVADLSALITSGPTPEQADLFASLDSGQQNVVGVMSEARETLLAATQLANAMEVLAARFNVGAPKPEGAEPGKPFDIAEYEGAASEFANTAGEFRGLIESLNELLEASLLAEQLPAVAAAAEAEGERVLRENVWMIAGTTFATFCAMLAALLVYRILVNRLASGGDAGRA
jgi:hypothetical protein